MKIKFALIPSEYISNAQDLSVKLQSAMEAGEMRVVDQVTDKLLSLLDKEYSPSLSEECWNQLIEKVKSFDSDFKSDYLITKPQLNIIFTAGVTELFPNVANVIKQALKIDGVVLQLPFEEEDANV